MKNMFLLLILFFVSFASYSQVYEVRDTIYQTENLERFKLFKTQNMWTFLKLDTRNGCVWQVQYSVKGADYRFETPISLISKVFSRDEFNGRFTLYQTDNIYNFLMLDQFDGRVWQVQWSQDADSRGVVPIN